MSEKVALVIPAAGDARRMRSRTRKPFLSLGGRPILHVTLERFSGVEGIVQTILAVNPGDYPQKDQILAETGELGVTDVVAGGKSRTESVANALVAVKAGVEIVLIHDAVRPFVSAKVIKKLISAAARTGAAIAAAPVKDTLKRVEEGLVKLTVAREELYMAQTPQAFRRGIIEEAYRVRGGEEFTDDAALVERSGGRVEIVESSYLNFKITTPADLALAEALLGAESLGRIHF